MSGNPDQGAGGEGYGAGLREANEAPAASSENSLPPPPGGPFPGQEEREPRDRKGSIVIDVDSAKHAALDTMQRCEGKRRYYFTTLLDKNTMYWQSFLHLIKKNQANNQRAIGYVQQKVAASRAYAASLYAIRDVVMDDKPGTTQGLRAKDRKRAGRNASTSYLRTNSTLSAAAAKGDPKRASVDEEISRKSALEEMFEMEEMHAIRLDDMCDALEEEVMRDGLKNMVAGLDREFATIMEQGEACLKLLQQLEDSSTAAFAAFRAAVDSHSRHPGLPPRAADAPPSDVWLADMNYRVAVRHQHLCWQSIETKLGLLFGKMKDLEINRRTAIKKSLSAVLRHQDIMWRELPPLKDPVIGVLARIVTDRELLDREISEAMHSTYNRIKAEGEMKQLGSREKLAGESKVEGGLQRAASTAGGAAGAEGAPEAGGAAKASTFLEDIQPPLSSPLVRRVTLLERRKDGLISRWQACLAVLTHDSFLHLFDVPNEVAVPKKGRPPLTHEEAFSTLMPGMDLDASVAKQGGKAKLDPNPCPVPSSHTVDLHICDVQFKPDGKVNSQFELTEMTKNTGIKSAFKMYTTRTFMLRGYSSEVMVDWVVKIRELGKEGLAQAQREQSGSSS